MNNRLGHIISELRKKKKLTQKEFADKLGISDKAVSRWETGNSYPDLDMLFRISKFFNISFENLLTARMVDDGTDDELTQNIFKEFRKHSQKIKRIVLAFIIIVIIFVITIIFTNTYNRFKVYQVGIENKDFEGINGIYVKTNIKDTLTINDLKIKNVEINNTDTVSVDLYYIENNKEHIIHNYSSLDNIVFTSYQSYIKIKDLSKYLDDLHIRITIINSDNEVKKYESKLVFTLDFSNNKIFLEDKQENLDYEYDTLSAEEIKEILLNNGFEELTSKVLKKDNDNNTIIYMENANKITYNGEVNHIKYQYVFNLNLFILEVYVYDENNLEIENYEYNVKNNQVLKCKTGSCNNYEEVMDILNKNVLDLLKK